MKEITEPLSFRIGAEQGYIKLSLDRVFGFPESTSYFGGYETQSTLEIKSNGFSVLTNLYISTGDIYNFYKELSMCYANVAGIAQLKSYDLNLNLEVEFQKLGQITILVEFTESSSVTNSIKFELTTDQTFIKHTLDELKKIQMYYGDNKGIQK